jgi:hypothetical protein
LIRVFSSGARYNHRQRTRVNGISSPWLAPEGSNAVILASANLQTWTPLLTNSLKGGSLNFTDTLASNFTSRFYRALLRP